MFFVVAFAVITSLSAYSTQAAKSTPILKTPNLSLVTSNNNLSSNGTLAVQVWADTGSQVVNAVRADLNYPMDKLNYVNIDTANTAFGVQAEANGANGSVNVERGSINPISGHLLVATVNFTALPHKANSSANITFASSSKLVNAMSNTDILTATYGGSYSL